MRLDRFVLKRAPGIPAGFTLEAGPGVNLVTGPNGMGKTTLCRAVRALLWPAGDSPYDVEAAFTVDGRPALGTREGGGDPDWTGSRPWLGPDHLATRYELGLLDLTVTGEGGDGLAREVRRQMAGGFDLEAVRKDLFGAGARTGMNEQKAWRKAADNVRNLEREQEGLAVRRDTLGDLKRRSGEAEAAGRRARLLGLLSDLAEARRARDEAAARRADLPDIMDRVREEDPRDLAGHRNREADLQREIGRLEAEIADLEPGQEGTTADGDPVLARRRLQDWREREGDHIRAHQTAEEARERAKIETHPGLGIGITATGLAGGGVLLAGGVFTTSVLPSPWPTGLMILGGILLGVGALALVIRRRDLRRAVPGLATRHSVADAEAQESTARRARNAARELFSGTFGPAADLAEAERRVDQLEARRERRAETDKQMAVAGESLRHANENLARSRANAAEILARLEVATDGEVMVLVDRLPAWREANEALRRAGQEIQRLEPEVAAGGALLKDGEEDLPPGRLAELIAQEETRAAGFAELHGEIAAIEREIELATRGHGLEDALAARTSARIELEAARDTVREAELGRFLLDEVAEEYEAAAQPEVLRAADQYFALFTGHRYELKLARAADGRDRFVARPTDGVKPLDLDELSDGTRAQLLLAVRLAFITTAEDEARPPLFLDDALTSADPERFGAIAAGLGRIALEEGRQVFYLTPNPADAAAFQRALTDAGLPAATNLDLAAIRGLAGAADPAALDPKNLPPVETAPDPAGLDVAAYAAALNVPRTDPWADPGALHVLYLAEGDLDLVRRLVDARADTWGRFAKARRTALAIGDITEAEAVAVAARGEVWESWLEGWRIGRAAPVTRAFLEESGAVSDKQLDSVVGLLDRVGGDGARLLAGLEQGEVKRFFSSKIVQLRDELAEAGLLDARNPLDEADRELFVLDRVAPHLRDGLLTKEKVRTLARTFAAIVSNPQS